MVEAKTQQPVHFYGHLMQSVAAGVLVLDEQGVVVSADQVAAATLEYEPDALVGCHRQVFWPEDSAWLDQLVRSGSAHAETTFWTQTGRPVPLLLTITPITGQTIGFLVSMTRLNDVQRLDDALSHTQRLAGIGTLTASVVHELNTPISIVTATCSNLLHEVEDNTLSMEQLMRYVDMIEQSAWRSARIIEVLRNYTYHEELQAAVTDLNIIIDDALTLVSHQFQGQFNVHVEKDLSPDLKSIVCDHNRMTQVIINLLVNASDAMQPGGGTIRIKSWVIPASMTTTAANGMIVHGDKMPQEQFAVSIQDTGHGIAAEMMDRIFNPFFTTKPNGQGTGLGLYIARRIITQHNGRIWAENNPDGGATFTFVLPRYQ